MAQAEDDAEHGDRAQEQQEPELARSHDDQPEHHHGDATDDAEGEHRLAT